MMDFFKKPQTPRTPAPPRAEPTPPPQPPASPVAPSASSPSRSANLTPTQGTTQAGVANRELDELQNITTDGTSLVKLVSAGLDANSLEETATLEQISELSARLLCRNRSRAAVRAYGASLLADKGATDESLAAAAMAFTPSYFRHTTSGDDDATQMWVCKLFLSTLPAAPDTTLCVRFSLKEHADAAADADADEDDLQYDLSLTVMQVAPFVAGASRFALSFELMDKRPREAADFTLDDAQRQRLTELKSLLGLTSSKWTAVGMLGVLLAALGCGQMPDAGFFDELVRGAREAHREELLANAGFY